MLNTYHIQSKPNICGPIAILNSIKDHPTNTKYSLNQLIKICQTSKIHLNGYHGTKP